MKSWLRATNSKQLECCLKMLYFEKSAFRVDVVENSRRKIEYHIEVDVSPDKFEELHERYRIQIS